MFSAYTTFYVLGQVMAMQVPFVGFQPVKTSEHMAAAGIFGLLQVRESYFFGGKAVLGPFDELRSGGAKCSFAVRTRF